MASVKTQQESLDAAALTAAEEARFFSAPGEERIDCLAAVFRTHSYAPHSHETYVVGVIEAGCEEYRLRGETLRAVAGDLCLVNPGDVHDGAPRGPFYAYRMTYPSIAFVSALAEDVAERRRPGTIQFPEGCISAPGLAARYVAAHRLIEEAAGRGLSTLAADEALLIVFAEILARHGVAAPAAAAETGPVGRALAFLDANLAEEVSLDRLAAIAGVPRARLIRAVARATGLTPHAWQTDRRVQAARRHLLAGLPPSEVAAACGFYDQSHLNRAFKARLGVTPGAFRAAARGESRPAPKRAPVTA